MTDGGLSQEGAEGGALPLGPGDRAGDRAFRGPPEARRWWGLVLVLAVAGAAASVVVFLWPTASFAGQQARATIIARPDGSVTIPASVPLAGRYVAGPARLQPQALAFRRRGVDQELRLTRLEERPEVLVLLQVPRGLDRFVPPRFLAGRLLDLQHWGARSRVVARLAPALTGKLGSARYLLIEGESPDSVRWALWAVGLLLGVCAVSFGLAARLWLPIRKSPGPGRAGDAPFPSPR